MWIARLFKQVKTSPQRLELTAPPLSLRVWIVHSPKTSHPTLVEGGGVSVLSDGGSAMCCVRPSPLSFLQVTQELMTFETTPWPPRIQKPAARTAP